jgi:MYXO-CTERM domain-containing protein
MGVEAFTLRWVALPRRLWIATLAAGVAMGSCSAPGENENVDAVPSSIVGGQPTPACAFPTTVAYFADSARCTATLVHPRMITVAAHCMEGPTPVEITFGDSTTFPSASARRVRIESCTEKGGQAANEDFAYCILADPVNDVPIVPILYGCETEIMRPGATVVLVGYGYIGANTPSPNGEKRAVSLKVDAVNQKTIVMGDATHGACFGDSGGPAYVRLPDGSWRVFGVTSGSNGAGAVCGALSEYAYTPYYVSWIEQTSGIDITPCYDANGAWNPDSRCAGFPMNPDSSEGTWATMCSDSVVRSGPSSVCGVAIDAGVPAPDAAAATDPTRSDGGSSGSSGAVGQSVSSGSSGAGEVGMGGASAGSMSGESGGIAGSGEVGGSGGSGTDAIVEAAPTEASGSCACRTGEAPAPARRSSWMALGLAALVVRRRAQRFHAV